MEEVNESTWPRVVVVPPTDDDILKFQLSTKFQLEERLQAAGFVIIEPANAGGHPNTEAIVLPRVTAQQALREFGDQQWFFHRTRPTNQPSYRDIGKSRKKGKSPWKDRPKR